MSSEATRQAHDDQSAAYPSIACPGTKKRMTLQRRLPVILRIRKITWSLRRPRSTPGLKN
ncbi:UNVERIFIED_CONTAM: hypothetical protein NCL1_10906 [Trichonephila clavipes]